MPVITKALTFNDLPSPPQGKTGWPWTEHSHLLGDRMPNGLEYPRISIVTPSYNQGEFIEETIRSVLLQGYPNLEYIIIDGGSTDNSLEIIKKYEPFLAYWESKKDRGQAHAINKGLEYCSGEIFNWINSDDYLNKNALSRVATNFHDLDILAGACRNFYSDGSSEEIIYNCNINFYGITGKKICRYHQPGVWLRTDLVKDSGKLDENLHYCFDGDLMMRYIHPKSKSHCISDILANFRLHETSKTMKSRRGQNLFYKDYVYTLQKLLRSNEFNYIHHYCEFRLKQLNWIDLLNEIKTDDTIPKWYRILSIFRGILEDPNIRFSRLTLGALRQLLMSKFTNSD